MFQREEWGWMSENSVSSLSPLPFPLPLSSPCLSVLWALSFPRKADVSWRDWNPCVAWIANWQVNCSTLFKLSIFSVIILNNSTFLFSVKRTLSIPDFQKVLNTVSADVCIWIPSANAFCWTPWTYIGAWQRCDPSTKQTWDISEMLQWKRTLEEWICGAELFPMAVRLFRIHKHQDQ